MRLDISLTFIFILLGLLFLLWRDKKMAADFTALNAAVAKLKTDVDALIAAQPNVQPQIDVATAAVEAVDATVLAATPPAA